METPLSDREYIIERFPGKGGWTYAVIPEIRQNRNNPFGWVRVKGTIDDFELRQYKLMPMEGGGLFLPIRSEIRKAIKKQEGNTVHIRLFSGESELEIPAEILECFELAHPRLLNMFQSFPEGERKTYLDWIAAAKKPETETRRIAEMLDRLEKGGFRASE